MQKIYSLDRTKIKLKDGSINNADETLEPMAFDDRPEDLSDHYLQNEPKQNSQQRKEEFDTLDKIEADS